MLSWICDTASSCCVDACAMADIISLTPSVAATAPSMLVEVTLMSALPFSTLAVARAASSSAARDASLT